MAVILKSLKQVTNTKVHLELYCDNTNELSDLSDITDKEVEAGSFAYDASGNLAIYNGFTWNVLE